MRNLNLDRSRVKTPDTSIPLDSISLPSDQNRPDDKAERQNEAFLMKELIEHLPQKEKDIIRMYLLEELSYEEMEACTGMKQGNLRQIVLRTRNKLKEQFTKIAQSWKN
jgi:RNA polymerase sigma-70 factor (ECF subfamily)